jgi:3-oxoacyl-[acyl-carrier-protein] synthase II
MKITFVYPQFEKFLRSVPELDASLIDYFLGDYTMPPSLGIPLLAALTPPEFEIELIDDNGGQSVNYDAFTDLVAINCFTPQATRAFEIADNFRARGKKVIMGGLFPSCLPDECLQHADSVNVGEGEPSWPKILADLKIGNLQRRYDGGCALDAAKIPAARREIFYRNEHYDWDEDLIQVMRGCLYKCPMCPLPQQMGDRIRFRPVENVLAEMRSLKHENVYLADDMLFFPHRHVREYSRKLFEALMPLGKKYFVNSTMGLSTESAFLDVAARAGVKNFYCTMNVEPVSIKALQGGNRERQLLIDLVKATEDRGIRFFASVAMGRDWDDLGFVDRALDLLSTANIHTAEFFIFTPFPGSPHWERMLGQKRIFDFHWSHFNGSHVVARPQNMTPEQLREQFVRIWREFFQMQKNRHAAALEPATWQNGIQVLGKPLQRQGTRDEAAITGIGLFSPIGHDAQTITSALRSGKHGLAPTSRFNTRHFRTNLFGEIKNFNEAEWLNEAELREYEDVYLRYAIVAARRALDDAGLAPANGEIRRNIAIVLGTCNGGLASAEAEYSWKHGLSSRPFDEVMNLQAQLYGFGKALASALKIGGETWVVTTACSSTTVALGLAQTLINRGYYNTVLVGGSDALCMANVSGFDAIKATSTTRMSPFSVPFGLNIGEAACFWVVEDLEKAILRQARCRGRIIGHATTSDAYHPTTPDPRGLGVARTLKNALADSGLTIADIGCLNAHGSATEANDKAETKGIVRFLGEHNVPVVSTKSFFGHCMGVAGILEATSQLLAMNENFIPPTLNFTEPRPGCTLDYVPNVAREKKYDAFISANYAFGGNNAAVAISKWDAAIPPRQKKSGRVVITGVGAVTSLGLGIQTTLEQLRRGTVGISPITSFPLTGQTSRLAGQVAEFSAAEVDRRLDFSVLNPISKFAVSAGRLALENAGLKITPANGDDAGVVMGVCNGSSEMGHMDSVFSSENYAANIPSFSNITSNSTAGWVSTQLYLKGVNASLSAGPHAGLQSLAYAFDALAEKRARIILAGAADEVYGQTFYNYDGMGFLFSGAEENDYRLRLNFDKRKVLGEGAAMLVMETAESANARGAMILAELLGYGMSIDAEGFLAANLGTNGLEHAVRLALSRAGIAPDNIGLLVWAPQGNLQDEKVLKVGAEIFGGRFAQIPLVTTTFNTGYIESTSILVSLASSLVAIDEGAELWPQRTGLPELDNRMLAVSPEFILALASTDIGYNFAAVLRHGCKA